MLKSDGSKHVFCLNWIWCFNAMRSLISLLPPKIQLRTLLSKSPHKNNYETHPPTTFHSIEHLQLVSARVASVVVKMPASTVYLVWGAWWGEFEKGSAQLMQTKSRMLLTHPSATAFATSSVKTSLPSTSCTLSPFHCWCIAEEGTSKADF